MMSSFDVHSFFPHSNLLFLYRTYPKAFPWGLLVKAQEKNPYRSKSLVGWWPEISIFKRVSHANQKGNCLW